MMEQDITKVAKQSHHSEATVGGRYPLQPQLDAITKRTRELVQPERLATTEQSITELQAAPVPGCALRQGDRVPQFALPDSQQRIVRSEDLLAIGPLIIDFFRG